MQDTGATDKYVAGLPVHRPILTFNEEETMYRAMPTFVDAAVQPAGDVTVVMSDFAYDNPATIPAGRICGTFGTRVDRCTSFFWYP